VVTLTLDVASVNVVCSKALVSGNCILKPSEITVISQSIHLACSQSEFNVHMLIYVVYFLSQIVGLFAM